jgi:hypothetical protein
MVSRPHSASTRWDEQAQAFGVHTPYAELDRQHNLLRARLAALQQAASLEAGHDCEDLLHQVEAARSSLALHFNFEENVGTLSFLVGAYPTLLPEIEHLRAEHIGFLAAFDRVAVALRSGSAAPDILGGLLSVLDHLVEHEFDERRLCRAALRMEPMLARASRVEAGRPGRMGVAGSAWRLISRARAQR